MATQQESRVNTVNLLPYNIQSSVCLTRSHNRCSVDCCPKVRRCGWSHWQRAVFGLFVRHPNKLENALGIFVSTFGMCALDFAQGCLEAVTRVYKHLPMRMVQTCTFAIPKTPKYIDTRYYCQQYTAPFNTFLIYVKYCTAV